MKNLSVLVGVLFLLSSSYAALDIETFFKQSVEAPVLDLMHRVEDKLGIGHNNKPKQPQETSNPEQNIVKDDPPVCPKGDHKVESLPYWDAGSTFPCMYAGTLKSSATNDHNLFYWMFKDTAKTDKPLVLWLNGGPGSSSMFGLFMETGPLRVKKTGTTTNDFQVGLAKESWFDLADLVFLD